MNPAQRLFRKAALEKVASPERLDEMMEVTAPLGWAALVALGLMVLAAILWGVFGSVSIKVHGRGILMRGSSLLSVTSDATGRVQEVLVEPGQVLEPGQPVVRINQPDLELRIDNTRAELALLRSTSASTRSAAGSIVGQLQAQRRDLVAKLASQRALKAKGLIAGGPLIDTQGQINAVDQQIAQSRSTGFAGNVSVAEVERRLKELEQKLKESTEIKSSYTGPVSELQINVGDLVQPGSRLLTLEPRYGKVFATLYVPAAEGKRVRPKMTVQVSPDTVRREEYGFILGEVQSVSSFPVSRDGMIRKLRNEKLADTLAGEGANFEVVVELTPDPATTSGFRWSSSKGPPAPVFTGTPCNGAVRVETKRPISYVLPLWKSLVGAV